MDKQRLCVSQALSVSSFQPKKQLSQSSLQQPFFLNPNNHSVFGYFKNISPVPMRKTKIQLSSLDFGRIGGLIRKNSEFNDSEKSFRKQLSKMLKTPKEGFVSVQPQMSLGHDFNNEPDLLFTPISTPRIFQPKLIISNHSTLENTPNLSCKQPAKQIDTGPHKHCHCAKSGCVKLYCECFAKGKVCSPECGCTGCKNCENDDHAIDKAKRDIIKRDPKAFQNKVSDAQHRKGCNCKKSHCMKNYCECYQLGVPCNDQCKCNGCQNCGTKRQKL